jgi:hypothetical protein
MAGKSLRFDLLVNTTQFARKLKEADNDARGSVTTSGITCRRRRRASLRRRSVSAVRRRGRPWPEGFRRGHGGLAKATAQLSRTTGLDAKTASEWVSVTKARGIESDKLNRSFVVLSTNLRNAAAGSKASAEAFKQVGVSQKDIASGDFAKVVGEVSDAFARMPDGTNKAALAQKLFGRQAQALLPMLNDGSKALKEQLDMAGEYGAALDKHGVEEAKKTIVAQRELKLAWEGVQIVLAEKVVPAIAKTAEFFAHLVRDIRNGTGVAGKLEKDFSVAFAKIKAVVGTVQHAITTFVAKNRDDIKAFGDAVKNVGRAVKTVFEDVLLPVIRRLVPAIRQVFQGAVTVIRGAVRVISGILTGDFGKAWDGVKDIFRGALRSLGGLIRAATSPFRQAGALAGKAIASGFKAGSARSRASGPLSSTR